MNTSLHTSKIKKLISLIGPGFITGAADDDPTAIATHSQTGALFGLAQLWVVIFSLPLLIAVQEMCGRIGLVTGQGLGRVTRIHYTKKILYPIVGLLIIANTINIGADLGAMAASAQLLIPLPFPALLILMVIGILLLEIFLSYKIYAKYLTYVALALFSYVLTAFVIKVDWPKALISSIIPTIHFNKDYLLNIVAILGGTISPYLFFWQATEEVEDDAQRHNVDDLDKKLPVVTKHEISRFRNDTYVGMLFASIIPWFIMLTAGSTFFPRHITQIETAQQAAQALKPLAGNAAFFLFAIGIISSGIIAASALSGSTAYAVSEAFNWEEGFSQKFKRAHGFYGVITFATLIGILINFTGIKPITALYYSAVINGVLAPPLLILILFIGNNKKIMKDHTNPLLSNFFGWLTIVIMTILAILTILSFFR